MSAPPAPVNPPLVSRAENVTFSGHRELILSGVMQPDVTSVAAAFIISTQPS